MPLYEYGCSACGHVVELMQSASLAKAPEKCEKCGAGPMEKMLSRTSFILKGDGWYKDGYSKESPTKSPTAEATPSTPDAAPASTPAASPTPSPAASPAATPSTPSTPSTPTS